MPSTFNVRKDLNFEGSFTGDGAPYVDFDGGRTIEEITIAPPTSGTALVAADFTLTVEVDEDKRVDISGAKLLQREEYEGKPATTGYFTFSFADVMASASDAMSMTALVTKASNRVKITLNLASSITGTGARLIVVTSAPREAEVFRLYCLREQVKVTTTGENEFSGFRKGLGEGQIFMRRSHIYGNVTHLEMQQGSTSPFGKNGLPLADNNALLKRLGKTTLSSCYTFDPVAWGHVGRDLFDTFFAQNPKLRALITTGDSNDCTAQTEYVYNMAQIAAARQEA